MKINRGFHITPRELRFGYGYTRDGLRCVWVRVRYGKIPPAVYPCSTLTLYDTLLEQNLLRIVEPYLIGEIEYVVQQVGQGRQAVEAKCVPLLAVHPYLI